MYKEVFVKSWQDLKGNLILLLPDAIMSLVNMALGILFLKSSGILGLLTSPEILTKEITTVAPAIKLFLKENLLKIILSLLLFIITSFMVGSGFTAMKLGAMKDLVKNKKITIRRMIRNGRYVWQAVSMKMIMFVIGVITFLFMLGTGIILSTFIFRGYVIIILGILFPLLMILLQFMLFFRYQAMFLENKHTMVAVKESFTYFLENKKHVAVVWLITTVVSLVTSPLSFYLGLIEEKIITVSLITIIGYLVRTAAIVVINVWSDMFKFRTYKIKPLKP